MLWIVIIEQIFILIYCLLLSIFPVSTIWLYFKSWIRFFHFVLLLLILMLLWIYSNAELFIDFSPHPLSLPLICFQQSISRYHTIPYISQSYTWWRPAEITPRYQICLPFQLQYCQGFVDCNPRSCHIRCFTYVHNVIICFFANQIRLSVIMLLRFAS